MAVLLTTQEVADRLNVSVRTVEAWRGKGVGPRYLQLPVRCVRYRPEDVTEWEAGKTRETWDSRAPAGKAG